MFVIMAILKLPLFDYADQGGGGGGGNYANQDRF